MCGLFDSSPATKFCQRFAGLFVMTKSPHQPDLIRAFAVFQQHAERLEESHRELQQQLKSAERELAQRHQELKQRVRQIEQMRDQLDGVLQTIDDAVFLIDDQGGIALSNEAGEMLLQRLEKAGISCLQATRIGEFLASKKPVNDQEFVIKLNGLTRHFLVSVLPVRKRSHNQAPGKVISLKDMTDYRQMEERLAREDRLAALGKVAASVAHEVRNPLSAIEGFGRLLEGDLRGQPTQAGLANKIVRASRQLNTVVSNLLSYTRDITCQNAPVDIRMLLLETAGFYEATASDLSIQFKLELEGDDLVIQGDAVQLRQAVSNILINAMDACKAKGKGMIALRGSKQGNLVRVSIEDDGCGMSAEVAARIFEPFFTTKDGGGIGLGMALCRRIIDEHQGRLEVDSREGQGTAMTLLFDTRTEGKSS